MKKIMLSLFFGVACIVGGTMVNNTSVCKMLLMNDVNSYTEPNGGVCNGAPGKCADGGCWSNYCHLETTITTGHLWWTNTNRIWDEKYAPDGQFACCWYEYVNTGEIARIHAAAYPLSCCGM